MVRAAALGVIVIAVGLTTSPAAAQQQQGGVFDFFSNLMKGTPEEEAACRPDVEKFCRDAEPDTFRVLGCLKESAGESARSVSSCWRTTDNKLRIRVIGIPPARQARR